MACNFSIPFSGMPEQVLDKAKSAVQGQGGTFEGDASSGMFDVTVFGNTIKGSYAVSGQKSEYQHRYKTLFRTMQHYRRLSEKPNWRLIAEYRFDHSFLLADAG